MKLEEKINFKEVGDNLGLCATDDYNLSEKEIEELFTTLTAYFLQAIDAIKKQNLEQITIAMSEASSYLIRTLYPRTQHKLSFIERYTNLVIKIKDIIFTQLNLEELFNQPEFTANNLSLTYQLSHYVNQKVLGLIDQSIDAEINHDFIFFYIINAFTHSLNNLVPKYIDFQVAAELDKQKNEGITLTDEEIDRVDTGFTKQISHDPLNKTDAATVDKLIYTHVLSQTIEQPLIEELSQQLNEITTRLESKKHFIPFTNGSITRKISLVKMLSDTLKNKEPRLLTFYTSLTNVMDSGIINHQRNLIFKIPLLSYLLSCIPKIKALLENGPETKQKLNEVKTLFLMRAPICTMGHQLNRMTMGYE